MAPKSGALAFLTPTPEEAGIAKDGSRILARRLPKDTSVVNITVREDGAEVSRDEEIAIPTSALEILVQLLTEMAQGHAVTLYPSSAELTTQQAADILNVSRPFMVKLLEEREMPFHMVGKHRRILAKDLFTYKERSQQNSRKILAELTAEAQDDGGYGN